MLQLKLTNEIAVIFSSLCICLVALAIQHETEYE